MYTINFGFGITAPSFFFIWPQSGPFWTFLGFGLGLTLAAEDVVVFEPESTSPQPNKIHHDRTASELSNQTLMKILND